MNNMENSTHTKGKWEIKEEPFTLLVTHQVKGNTESICQISTRYKTEDEIQANAKLISAAPELLEALQMIIEACNPTDVTANKIAEGVNLGPYYLGSCGIPSNEAIHEAISAIKKATGHE